jgi:hypothetical protein
VQAANTFICTLVITTRLRISLGCGHDGTAPVVTLLDRQLGKEPLARATGLDLFNFRFPCRH